MVIRSRSAPSCRRMRTASSADVVARAMRSCRAAWVRSYPTTTENTNIVPASARAYDPVIRVRMEATAAALRLDHVADAADGGDQLPAATGVELLAQVVDHDVHDVRARIEVIPPGVLGDERAAHHAPHVPGEVFEHEEFLRRELDRLAAAAHVARVEVHLEVGHPEPSPPQPAR